MKKYISFSFWTLGKFIMESTLDYLINIQDVIIMHAGNLPKINKYAGCNKTMQVGIFQKLIVK